MACLSSAGESCHAQLDKFGRCRFDDLGKSVLEWPLSAFLRGLLYDDDEGDIYS